MCQGNQCEGGECNDAVVDDEVSAGEVVRLTHEVRGKDSKNISANLFFHRFESTEIYLFLYLHSPFSFFVLRKKMLR